MNTKTEDTAKEVEYAPCPVETDGILPTKWMGYMRMFATAIERKENIAELDREIARDIKPQHKYGGEAQIMPTLLAYAMYGGGIGMNASMPELQSRLAEQIVEKILNDNDDSILCMEFSLENCNSAHVTDVEWGNGYPGDSGHLDFDIKASNRVSLMGMLCDESIAYGTNAQMLIRCYSAALEENND